jgi:hydrogenase nickel incorporation protein HypB
MQVDIGKPILDLNDKLAEQNRALLDQHGIYMLDLLASPGAGKTSTILATIEELRARYRIAVIEGDIASDVDSQKIKASGIPAVQINTGGACHLEAKMVQKALAALDAAGEGGSGGLEDLDLILIENVGNLVCPTDFYLGEDAKVMILSVPEGHDKPLKYPGIFQVSKAVILNKIDTRSAFDFDENAFRASVTQLNPQAMIFPLAATKNQGVKAWCEWLSAQVDNRQADK